MDADSAGDSSRVASAVDPGTPGASSALPELSSGCDRNYPDDISDGSDRVGATTIGDTRSILDSDFSDYQADENEDEERDEFLVLDSSSDSEPESEKSGDILVDDESSEDPADLEQRTQGRRQKKRGPKRETRHINRDTFRCPGSTKSSSYNDSDFHITADSEFLAALPMYPLGPVPEDRVTGMENDIDSVSAINVILLNNPYSTQPTSSISLVL